MNQSLEQWRPVVGYEHGYEVSDAGNVRSLFRSRRLLKPAINRQGYKCVALYDESGSKPKTKAVHRLVAHAFVENQDALPWVNHINGIKTDNTAVNLEWCSPSYNTQHAAKTGLLQPCEGEANGRSVLTDRERLAICRLADLGLTQKKIGEIFDVSASTIGKVVMTWTNRC